MQVIMGIDPGSRVTGFGVIGLSGRDAQPVAISHGAIVLPTHESMTLRLGLLVEDLHELLEKYQPDSIAIEKIFLGKSADSAFKLGHARGAVLAEASRWARRAKKTLEIKEYATRSVKQALTGNGSADKSHVQLAVCRILGLRDISPLDASDALALAVTLWQKQLEQSALSRMKEIE